MIAIGRKGSKLYSVGEEEIFPHIIIVGKTGCGKSSLAAKLVRGLKSRRIVIDPHGDLCWRSGLPVYFPGEIYLNPLEGGERALPDLIYSLKNSFGKEFWGPRTEHILTCLVSSLKGKGANFSDLYFLLLNREFLKEFFSKKRGAFDISSIKEESSLPLLNKISPFVLRAPLREFLCRRKSKIPRGSFCLNSDIGIYGRENSRLICSFFFSFLVQKELNRRERTWIFCDEFHMYLCPSFNEVLAEGRKFGISLALISSKIPDGLEDSIFSNSSAAMIFRCSRRISKKISQYYEVSPEEIAKLKPREFIFISSERKVKLKTLYVKGERRRDPMPERILKEDVLPISALSEVRRPELWEKVLGLKGDLLKELLSTFP